MIDIILIQEALNKAGYMGVAGNDPSIFKAQSPHTGRFIIIPMSVGAKLPESAVRHVLEAEPDVDDLISQMH